MDPLKSFSESVRPKPLMFLTMFLLLLSSLVTFKAVTAPLPLFITMDVFLSILLQIPHIKEVITTTNNNTSTSSPSPSNYHLLHNPLPAFETAACSWRKTVFGFGTSILKAGLKLATLVTMANKIREPVRKYFTQCVTRMFGLNSIKGVGHQKAQVTWKRVGLFLVLLLVGLKGSNGRTVSEEGFSKGIINNTQGLVNAIDLLEGRDHSDIIASITTPTPERTTPDMLDKDRPVTADEIAKHSPNPTAIDSTNELVKALLQELAKASSVKESPSLSRHLRTVVIGLSTLTLVVGILYLYWEIVVQMAKKCSLVTVMLLAAVALIISVIDYIVQTGLTMFRQARGLNLLSTILRPSLYSSSGLPELTPLIGRYFPPFLSLVGLSSLALSVGLIYYSRVKDGKNNTGFRRQRTKGISPAIEEPQEAA